MMSSLTGSGLILSASSSAFALLLLTRASYLSCLSAKVIMTVMTVMTLMSGVTDWQC